jgi:hypothetical protein
MHKYSSPTWVSKDVLSGRHKSTLVWGLKIILLLKYRPKFMDMESRHFLKALMNIALIPITLNMLFVIEIL